jgi:acetamidase/formamidase
MFRNNQFTDGIIGPGVKMLGPVHDGATVVYETAPGCWGPMITPKLKGGHEVNVPVAIEDAKVGDSVLVKIKRIRVKSRATSSGVDQRIEGRFTEDPSVMKKCSQCGTEWPEARAEGVGLESIKCVKCGASASPFRMTHGYTMVFDDAKKLGLTVGQKLSDYIARNALKWANIPSSSKQFSILLANKYDLQGTVSAVRPFMGQLGTTPSVNIPDSRNAGDSATALLSKTHRYSITEEQLETCLTDGHMDIDAVREGATLICPVKVDGGGLYAGDMHAMQGDGEIAGHTTDVSGELTVEVCVIKNLRLDGPLLLPRVEDLPPLARPLSRDHARVAEKMAAKLGVDLEKNAPVQVIGTGSDLNKAVMKGMKRAASAFGMSLEEVRNRITITGGIEIGRLAGVVQVTLGVPFATLDKIGISKYVRKWYKHSK